MMISNKVPTAILSLSVLYISIQNYAQHDHETYPLITGLVIGIMYLLATSLFASTTALAYHLALLASALLFTTTTGPALATHSGMYAMLSVLGAFGILWFGSSWYFVGPVWEAGEKQSPFAKEWYRTVGSGGVGCKRGDMEPQGYSRDGKKTG